MKASNQVVTNAVFTKEVEIQRLSWLDALFTSIRDNLESGETNKAQKLAELGQYLTQDFQHYSEDDLAGLNQKQEVTL
ncbi:MAG: hypothetical protein ABS921_11430 [Psychrobacter alimentarius]